jgi:hypothetical protein
VDIYGNLLEQTKTHVLDQHETLSVRDDLRGVQGLFEVVDEGLLVTLKLGGRTSKDLAGADALVLDRTEAAREDSLADKSDGHAEVEGVDGSPLASTLLAGLVKNLLKEGGSIVILVLENVAGDFNQEGVQDTSVPLVKDLTDLEGSEAETALEDIVGL